MKCNDERLHEGRHILRRYPHAIGKVAQTLECSGNFGRRRHMQQLIIALTP